jgi:ParB family transcriptional regulator, chromosome partitioning protein
VSVSAASREFRDLPLSMLDEPALPSRSEMDDAKLDELAASIRAHGLIQPIVVGRVGDRFQVIAGHRRWHACQRAGLAAVPCVVYPSMDVDLTVIQAHENSRREDLNAADEAAWFHDLFEGAAGRDVDKLCALVGEKRSYVENRLALFLGDPEIFAALQRGQIKIGVAHELNKLPDEKYRRFYLQQAIQGGATQSMIVGWIAEWKTMFAAPQGETPAGESSTPAMPTEPHNPFTCAICLKSNNVHLIVHVPMHQHCKLAIFDSLMEGHSQQ